jgi:hypothetical protein
MQMGTCYMHQGYDSVRAMLREYNIDTDQEVTYGGNVSDTNDLKNYTDRQVYDLNETNDLGRKYESSLTFNEWIMEAFKEDMVCAVCLWLPQYIDTTEVCGCILMYHNSSRLLSSSRLTPATTQRGP